MPKIFTSIIKRTTTIITGGGSVNAAPPVNAGVSIGNKTTGTPRLANLVGGIGIAFTNFIGLITGAVGTGLTGSVSGTANNPALANGSALTAKADLGAFNLGDGAELVQIKYDLIATNGSSTATSSGSWATPTNAQGTNNGTFATNANTVTVAASGNLVLAYAGQVNKTDLTISSVILKIYDKNVAGAVGPVSLATAYSLDSGATYPSNLRGTTTASFDNTATPLSVDLTAAFAGDWSKVAAFRARWNYNGAASATASTVSVDAAILVITASRTDIP